MRFIPFLLLVLLSACGGDEATGGPAPAAQPSPPPTASAAEAPVDPAADPAVAALRRAIEEVRARPEVDAAEVEVRHILIAHAGAPGLAGVTRSIEEAEQLAAALYARIQAGESVASLVAEHSDDKGERYVMTAERPAAGSGKHWRKRMMPSFGGFAWKLQVGEVGVAPYHPQKCVYGWHIIERLR